MNSRKPIIPAPSSAPTIRLGSNDFRSGLVQFFRVFFDRIAIAGEGGIGLRRCRGVRSGSGRLQIVAAARMTAHPASEQSDEKDPTARATDTAPARTRKSGSGRENLFAVLLYERSDDGGVAHAVLLHLEDLRARRLAEMALAAGHVAVQIVFAAPHWQLICDADALDLIAFDLRFGLREAPPPARTKNRRPRLTRPNFILFLASHGLLRLAFLRHSHHFGARIRARHLARNQHTSVPPISVTTPIQIHVTSGNT